jgi:hypothetical protein
MRGGAMKKRWSKAQLIVLMRGVPGEAVLLVCKTHGNGGAKPGVSNDTCKPGLRGDNPCPAACQGVTGS